MGESQRNGGGKGQLPPEAASGSLRALATVDSGPEARGGKTADAIGIGSVVGRYVVLERLGAGAMGVVFAAYDPDLDRKIALKLLPAQHGGDRGRREERLVREAKAIAKLSHPNTVGIYDVGVHQDQVFLAMEHLGGGTLRRWLSSGSHPWREVLAVLITAGRGLEAAHAENLIHRDFKPENVLLDKNGVAKVADFGLVRLSAAMKTPAHKVLDGDDNDDLTGSLSDLELSPATLTRTGALMGTPAYMAPEQFLARSVDARTDQFSFCVTLYEALYGERPFAGESVPELAASVTKGQVRAPPKGTDVPAWVRTCVIRGLAVNPDDRHPTMDQLIAALGNDPVARWKRRGLIAAALTTLAAAGLITRHQISAKNREIDSQVAAHVALADGFLTEAATKRSSSKQLRARTFAAFDGFERDKGEELWAQSVADARAADDAHERGIKRLEAAVTLRPRGDLKVRIADALVDYLEIDGRPAADREAGLRQLAVYDEGGARTARLNAPATVRIETTPPGFAVRIEKYDPVTYRVAEPVRAIGRSPIELSLAPGSYRFSFEETSTHVGFHYPVLLNAGDKRIASVPVPLRTSVPPNFVYVPPGLFLFGSANEELRTGFLETVPIHPVDTGQFLISATETTVSEWIAFLDSLPERSRSSRLPHGSAEASGGFVELRRASERDGRWAFAIKPASTLYRARDGEPIVYRGRSNRSAQDWRSFPVTGISPEDAAEYCGWLDSSGRVPGARVCTEWEWERTARGADARDFPHGAQLAPDDANFDLTYGRKNEAYGPDVVGAHLASRSPFGTYDMVGNVWELTRSMLDRGQVVIRGGSFYQFRPAQRSTNRQPIATTTRDHTIGLRVCASLRP